MILGDRFHFRSSQLRPQERGVGCQVHPAWLAQAKATDRAGLPGVTQAMHPRNPCCRGPGIGMCWCLRHQTKEPRPYCSPAANNGLEATLHTGAQGACLLCLRPACIPGPPWAWVACCPGKGWNQPCDRQARKDACHRGNLTPVLARDWVCVGVSSLQTAVSESPRERGPTCSCAWGCT